MKKWMKGLAVGFLAFVLVACGNEAEKPAETKPGTDVTKTSDLTLEEVFKKAQEASENMKSMHAEMDMTQKMSFGEEEVDTDATIEMDMIQDPLAMHQIMKMDFPEMGTMETEFYMNEKGIFMKNPEGQGWMKLPMENFDELMASVNANAEATVDYETLSEFVEDFKFEQDDKQYILKLKASGEQFKKIVEEQINSTGLMEGIEEEGIEALKGLEIHELEYELFIDKETFDTTAFNLWMDFEMDAEGEKVRMKQDVKTKISQINGISEIVIPQEVLDQVVEY